MSSSSFSLLRLPSLALVEIIQRIELKSLCKLSFCSKRMHFIVKHYRYKSTVSLKLSNLEVDIRIRLFHEKCYEDKVTFIVRDSPGKDSIGCKAFKIDENMGSFWNDVIQGTETHIEYLCDLFAAKVEEVDVYHNSTWMLNMIEERQGGYSYDAEVWNRYRHGHSDEQLRHILLDLNPRSLHINYKASDQFRIENFHKKYEKLTIFIATWMTGENLCQLDCVELCIDGRYFSNMEINRYLKHVLSGGALRLRKFFAGVQDANEDVMLDGVRELLTGIERFEDERGSWTLNGKVARREGLVLVSIKFSNCEHVFLEIK